MSDGLSTSETFSATARLRWLDTRTTALADSPSPSDAVTVQTGDLRLQQLWIGSEGSESWEDVPTVVEPIAP